MLQGFKNFIEKEKLFSPNEKILLAVSGGVDSVVMCHLFQAANLNFGIAHCNFQLRGDDAEKDALFVKNLAESFQVAHFEIAFDTENFAKENKLSIQVAARELRYDWLEKIRKENDFQYLATAHHLDDSLETVLYNFTKGCGIRGLHGILPKKNTVIRPLLFTHKKEVLDFVKKHKIEFREDVSNRSDKYARNHIRHHVIPLLEKINPSVSQTAKENIERLRETELIFNYAIELLQKEICEQRGEQLFIHLEKLKHSPAPATLLFEILNPFGYNNTHTKQMIASIGHQSGAVFYSDMHEVLLDREFFILKKRIEAVDNQVFIIEEEDLRMSSATTPQPPPKGENVVQGIKSVENLEGSTSFSEKQNAQTSAEASPPLEGVGGWSHQVAFPNGKLNFQIKNTPYNFSKKGKHTAAFDFEKLTFPLTLRQWKAGDAFQPLGMNGQTKKVKSLLTGLKLNRFEKENVWVLESGGEICWVVGIRMDERFKITSNTKQCLELSWMPQNPTSLIRPPTS